MHSHSTFTLLQFLARSVLIPIPPPPPLPASHSHPPPPRSLTPLLCASLSLTGLLQPPPPLPGNQQPGHYIPSLNSYRDGPASCCLARQKLRSTQSSR
ncbi:hypothetical protein F4780DRAFT_268004 [Xylariomycetidae sp. FL0641]|nr:hypothetical protein F4780DRAFT_268004 [Xylariomycetidae sp. FL0641]